MALVFQPLFDFTHPGSPVDYTYVLSLQQQPADGPWVGAFAYQANVRSPMRAISLDDFFAQVLSKPGRFSHAGFLFLPKAPDASGMEKFRDALVAAAAGFPSYGSATTMGGFVLWLDKLDTFSLADTLLLSLPANGPTNCDYDLDQKPYRLCDAGGAGRTLFFDARPLGKTTALRANADGLELRLDGTPTIAFGDTTPARAAISLSKFTIPLSGPTAGCIVYAGTNAGALIDFEFGFQYGLTTPDGTSNRLWFPLLDRGETLAGAAVTGVIDPVGSTGPVRNQMRITPAASGTFTSAYRTGWDEKITLRPAASGNFVGAAAPGAPTSRLYFVPAGDFAMAAPGAAVPNHTLVCGLSALEDLSFIDGDVLRFTPVPNGGITVGAAPSGGYSFTPDAGSGLGTAWAMMVQTVAKQPYTVYRSESARSPLFSPQGSATILRHDGFAMRSLPQQPDAKAMFPMLPYAAVPQMDGFGSDPDAIASFEAGYLAPTRSKLIRALPAQSANFGDTRTVAVTPQGYIVGLNGKGDIMSIELGCAAGSKLVFEGKGPAAGQPLRSDIRDAFLASQQFIVISCATDDYNDYVTATLGMSGWQFTFAPPAATEIAPGDYESVLIIKSAQGKKFGDIIRGTVSDLAATPSVWTAYSNFNAAGTDPTGQVLSSWLTTYMANAKAQYADGTGLPGLQTFCELIDDPNWDGFLFLRVPVAAGKLDPALGFLLAGVDPTQLVAHHLGCAVNHTKPDPSTPATPYQPDSSYFGLVHYVKPGTPPDGSAATGYVSSSAPYDFQLLFLEALFENSALKSFSSTALVVLNTLFGDNVLSNYGGAGPAPTNTIVIHGALQQHDGAASYVFATAPGATSTLYLSSAAIDRVEIDRAVVADNPDVGTRSSVTFQMAGWLGTLPVPPAATNADPNAPPAAPFDLLSYAAISFVNFGLVMAYDSEAAAVPGANKTFAPDLSSFSLTVLSDKKFTGDAVDTGAAAANTLYRDGSLVASFPLVLRDFIIGQTSKAPTDLGYRALATNPSTNGVALKTEWYGLEFDLPLGGSGSLDAAGLINANLLFAWNANGAGTPAFTPYIKLSGPGGVNLSFDLEGILKFGADGIVLTVVQQTSGSTYVLKFASIGITIFTRSFPPKGSTNLLLAGFGDRSLGWFGGYIDPTAPPLTPP